MDSTVVPLVAPHRQWQRPCLARSQPFFGALAPPEGWVGCDKGQRKAGHSESFLDLPLETLALVSGTFPCRHTCKLLHVLWKRGSVNSPEELNSGGFHVLGFDDVLQRPPIEEKRDAGSPAAQTSEVGDKYCAHLLEVNCNPSLGIDSVYPCEGPAATRPVRSARISKLGG